MDQTSSTELLHKDIIKMQRLAKKRRTFLIQKITKRIKQLKSKKGNELQLKKNQRKIERLLQRICDMKELNFDDVVSELVKLNYEISEKEHSNTKDWFMYELTQDKSSLGFMSFVNSKKESNDGTPEDVTKSANLKRNEVSEKSTLKKPPEYKEKEDEVLNDIIKVKKNRPGQRARQKHWEELYGKGAKHLHKKKTVQSKKSDKSVDNSHQAIIQRLKRKNDENKNKEHPSWLAKRQQASLSSKIDVFAGKRTILTDD